MKLVKTKEIFTRPQHNQTEAYISGKDWIGKKMESKHILSSFDDDLNKLNNNLLKLGNGALDQFEKCINNYGTQNLEDIENVISADKILDDLMMIKFKKMDLRS